MLVEIEDSLINSMKKEFGTDNISDGIYTLLNSYRELKEDIEDIKLFNEAKKDRDGIKGIDELLKEYNIES
jgi:hypothetical protein